MQEYTDYFILGYSNISFSGKPLPPPSFAPFEEEIKLLGHRIYLHFTDLSKFKAHDLDNPWLREIYQRNDMVNALIKLQAQPHDLIFVSDTDEFPTKETIEHALTIEKMDKPIHLTCTLFYYNFNVIHRDDWRPPYFITYGSIKGTSLNDFRMKIDRIRDNLMKCVSTSFFFPTINHFIVKTKSYSHQEFNKQPYQNTGYIYTQIACGKDIYRRNIRMWEAPLEWRMYIPNNDPRFLFLQYPGYYDDLESVDLSKIDSVECPKALDVYNRNMELKKNLSLKILDCSKNYHFPTF